MFFSFPFIFRKEFCEIEFHLVTKSPRLNLEYARKFGDSGWENLNAGAMLEKIDLRYSTKCSDTNIGGTNGHRLILLGLSF
jgi:hypothetical protein